MKAIMIMYNQALTEKVEYMLEKLQIKGYSQWPLILGSGSDKGEPRLGTHTWPEMNSATLTIVEDNKVDAVLESIKKMDAINYEIGIRAFVWNIEKMA